MTNKKAAARKAELQAIEWKPLWLKPAIFAAVVMVLFGLLFRDKVTSTESPLDHPPIESA